jgi:hypothetical protein
VLAKVKEYRRAQQQEAIVATTAEQNKAEGSSVDTNMGDLSASNPTVPAKERLGQVQLCL